MLLLIGLIFCAFLLGSVSTAVIVCRYMSLPDPRAVGSHNPGTTNVLRIGGKKAAVIVLIGDGLKGFLPVGCAQLLGLDLWSSSLVALAAFLGHTYPIFHRFKGGKGVATFLGALFALDTFSALLACLTWLLVAKLLHISSLSGMATTLLAPVYFYALSADKSTAAVLSLIALWIVFNHRQNIIRLINKQESKI